MSTDDQKLREQLAGERAYARDLAAGRCVIVPNERLGSSTQEIVARIENAEIRLQDHRSLAHWLYDLTTSFERMRTKPKQPFAKVISVFNGVISFGVFNLVPFVVALPIGLASAQLRPSVVFLRLQKLTRKSINRNTDNALDDLDRAKLDLDELTTTHEDFADEPVDAIDASYDGRGRTVVYLVRAEEWQRVAQAQDAIDAARDELDEAVRNGSALEHYSELGERHKAVPSNAPGQQSTLQKLLGPPALPQHPKQKANQLLWGLAVPALLLCATIVAARLVPGLPLVHSYIHSTSIFQIALTGVAGAGGTVLAKAQKRLIARDAPKVETYERLKRAITDRMRDFERAEIALVVHEEVLDSTDDKSPFEQLVQAVDGRVASLETALGIKHGETPGGGAGQTMDGPGQVHDVGSDNSGGSLTGS